MWLGLAPGEPPRPAAHFGDHMVLQRECEAPLWGWAEPGERVRLRASWPGAGELATRADGEGRFEFLLPTPRAGGPHELTLSGAHGTRTLSDVLVGELWLASGQSNMEWTLGPRVGNGVEGWEEAARDAFDPFLRLFEVENVHATRPEREVRGEWRAATPESAAAFSATAYFFARRLRRELGCPVGVIGADWGGTPAEAWTPAQELGDFPEFAEPLKQLSLFARDPRSAEERWRAASADYWARAQELDARRGLAEAAEERCDESGWDEVLLPTPWEQHGLADFDGLAWYRRTVTLPAEWAGQVLQLELGAIDDRDTVYWNGARIGGHEDDGQWQTPRRYEVPGALTRAGSNTLAVRVLDTGGLGGFASGPESLRLGRGDESALSLAGSWRFRAGTPLGELGWPPAREPHGPWTPSALWNGMVAPLVPSALAGVIWYQGEANCGRAEQYERLFPRLIAAWRAAFRREFPFLFVQLAPFAYGGDTGQAAALRDAQRKTLARVARAGMAVTMDIGDPDDIHPTKKREVGERLALHALSLAYGGARERSGPLYRSCAREGRALRISFDHARGLTARDGPVRHLLLAGEDRVFHPAVGRVEGETLVVESVAVEAPVAVRFGWGAADQTNLWNGAELPASSFRSDDWSAP
jgi:sialate O-acetylesterase